MRILITEKPSGNTYIDSLMNAYKAAGHSVYGDVSNFFHSNIVPDALHIHWPERLHDWYPHKGKYADDWLNVIEARLKWYKDNQTVIIHTVHNLRPHEAQLKDSESVFHLIISYADIIVHHCENSINQISEAYPESRSKKNIICHHGDYLIDYREVDQIAARRRLKLPEDHLIILNFGKQRPYKNQQDVISAFRQMRHQKKYLVIAGEFIYHTSSTMQRFASRLRNHIRETLPNKSIRYIYKRFVDNELADIICASDIVLLCQQRALNSGVLPLAATFNRPAVYPDTGCFKETMDGWWGASFQPGDTRDAADKLDSLCRQLIDKEFVRPSNASWLEQNSWQGHVDNILINIEK